MQTKLHCVLLVDDDDITNFLNRSVLLRENIAQNIRIAESADEAIRLVEKRIKEKPPGPDLIFLDLNMPGMNGWDFIEEYKQLAPPEDKKPVIIVLTTSANPDDEKRAKQSPYVAGYLKKPLTREMVREVVKEHF